MAENAIEVEELVVSLDGTEILRKVNAVVERGCCLALLGPSGSGKTTLLRAIAGFVRPKAGTIKIFGTEMKGVPPELRPVSMLFQRPALFDEQTVEDNALFGLLRREDRQTSLQRVQQLAEAFKLTKFLKEKVSRLSGGEKQRAAFIRTFANAKDIMLLDEPIRSAFDLHQRRELMRAIKECARQAGLTTILVTHEFEEAAYLADKLLVLVEGKSWSKPLRDMYFSPEDLNVARVLGYGNELDARVVLDRNHREQMCPLRIPGTLRNYSNATCAFFRPNSVQLIQGGRGFKVESVSFSGTLSWIVLRPTQGGDSIEAAVPSDEEDKYKRGQEVGAEVPADHISFFDLFGGIASEKNDSISI